MGNRLSFGAKGTHEAEILQSPSTKDKAKAACGYTPQTCVAALLYVKYKFKKMIQPKANNGRLD